MLTRFWGHLTDDEKDKLVKYKTNIFSIIDTFPIDISSFMDDLTCLRFLRARKFDLEKTKEMFMKYCKWRVEYQMDKIFQFRYPESDEVKKCYPQGYHKTDMAVNIYTGTTNIHRKNWVDGC